MRRRDLIAAFDGAAEWPLSMTARQVASSVIGLVGGSRSVPTPNVCGASFDFLAGSHLQGRGEMRNVEPCEGGRDDVETSRDCGVVDRLGLSVRCSAGQPIDDRGDQGRRIARYRSNDPFSYTDGYDRAPADWIAS